MEREAMGSITAVLDTKQLTASPKIDVKLKMLCVVEVEICCILSWWKAWI